MNAEHIETTTDSSTAVGAVAGDIMKRDSFHPNEYRHLFGDDVGPAEFGVAIHKATQMVLDQHNIVFRARGDGVMIRVEGATAVAERAARFRRTARRKGERALKLMDVAVAKADTSTEAAALVSRRARMGDVVYTREQKPVSEFKHEERIRPGK